jgi:O-antigen/teichoic acid export membrane protein
MHPRKFIRDSFGIAFAQYVVRGTLMLRTLLAARLLGPLPLGAWNALQLLMDNGNLALFGTQQGLDQMVPSRIVTAPSPDLARLKRAALFNVATLSLVYATGCLVLVHIGSSRVLAVWGLPGVVAGLVCVLTTNLANYQTSIQRSHGDMTTVGFWMLLQGAIGGGLGLLLLPEFGIWGLLGGWTLGCAAAFAYSTWRSGEHAPRLPSPAADGLDLMQVGFPMFVFLASSQVMRQLDRLIILRYLGMTQLGYYGLAVMALTFLLYVPDSVTYVLYPQLVREFGESEQNPGSIRPRIERVLQASSLIVPALGAVAFLFASPVIRLFLPRFVDGIPAMRVLCFGAVGLAFGNFASVVLMTLGRQTLLIPAALLAAAVGAGLDLLAVKLGFGITGVAWATVATYSASGGLLLTMALAGLGLDARSLFGTLGRLFAPLTVALVIATGLERGLPWKEAPEVSRHVWRVLISTGVFTVVYVVAVYPLTRGLGLRQVLSEFNVPILGPLLRRFGGGNSPPSSPSS